MDEILGRNVRTKPADIAKEIAAQVKQILAAERQRAATETPLPASVTEVRKLKK